ncbi:hypothetical protein Zm00014a_036139 [Zea mays]|uniref:DUF4283 domain-containing protein n=1 Tax=Zea mays TaxID=4577 RepID=A0A3L6FAY9_MAIZE|nr:hypothetical protein Zm00014a_036139 [Zea mays]
MIEWGVVQTKFNASMSIEEKVLPVEVKSTLGKVWVQFTGIPKEMMDFLLIWVVGSILGVTKAVDMKFTNKYKICRLQVLVLDASLLPQFVDVVIGDKLYELQFRVEENMDNDNPEPMDMEDLDLEVVDEDQQNNGNKGIGNALADPNVDATKSKQSSTHGMHDNAGKFSGKKVVDLDSILEDGSSGSGIFQGLGLGDELHEALGEEEVGRTRSQPEGVPGSLLSAYEMVKKNGQVTLEVAVCAAVPAVYTGSSLSYRSKRRAATSAGDSLERASRLKASRNLDSDFMEGNESLVLCSMSVQQVVDKLRPLGFFGNNSEEFVHKFANFLVKLEQSKKLDFKQQARSRALDKEERERADEAELDNFILGVLFEDNTDEVMDMESEHIAMSRTDMSKVTKGSMRRIKSNSFESK